MRVDGLIGGSGLAIEPPSDQKQGPLLSVGIDGRRTESMYHGYVGGVDDASGDLLRLRLDDIRSKVGSHMVGEGAPLLPEKSGLASSWTRHLTHHFPAAGAMQVLGRRCSSGIAGAV